MKSSITSDLLFVFLLLSSTTLVESQELDRTSLAWRAFEFQNNVRNRYHMDILKSDRRLQAAAEEHALEMAQMGQVTHAGVLGGRVIDRISSHGYHARAWGENIGTNQDDPNGLINSWTNSSPHRSIMLNPYTYCGFGVAYDERGKKYWCCVYALP